MHASAPELSGRPPAGLYGLLLWNAVHAFARMTGFVPALGELLDHLAIERRNVERADHFR